MTDQPANETETPEQTWERPMLFPLDAAKVIQNDDGSHFDGNSSS
jgi:hypothetical protein